MTKRNVFKVIFLVLTLALMLFIFSLSGQKASVSTDTSHSVSRVLLTFLFRGFDVLSSSEQIRLIATVDNTVRTLAHFSEYMLLSFLFAANLIFYSVGKIKKALLSLAGCFIFSLFDEIHQMFVPGRTFQLIDLFFDFLGSLTGLILFYVAVIILRKIKKS